jgi:hypothetical protein
MLCGKFWFELIGIPHSQQNDFPPLPARLITQLVMAMPGSHDIEAIQKLYNSSSTHHSSPRGLVYHCLTHTLDATSLSISQTYGFCYRPGGIQKNRNLTDCATMKLLTFESWRNRHTWICMMAMDATACYDCIITYLANLYERRHSLPKTACMAKVKTLFNVLHRVRMAYR